MPGVEFVPDIVLELAKPTTSTLVKTSLFAGAGVVAHKVRNLWKLVEPIFLLFSFKDLRVNTDYAKGAGFGLITHIAIGDRKELRYFSRFFLIAATIVRIAETSTAYANAKGAFNLYGRQPYAPTTMKLATYQVSPNFLTKVLGPSKAIWVKTNFSKVVFKVKNAGYYGFMVIKEGFLLSMAYADAFEAWRTKRSVGDMANIDVVRNVNTVFNQKVISKSDATNLITNIGAKYGINASPIIGVATTIISTSHGVYEGTKRLANKADGAIANFFKNGLFAAISGIGGQAATSILPESWIPQNS